MPRRRRFIESGCVYELCFRAKNTLPLVAYECVKLIIQSVLARTQRDDKVILCHDIWNGSHPHIIVVARDAQQFINFYSEIQKKITDILKRLLALEHLEIWDGKPTVIKLGNIAAVRERIAYLYANPANDNLEESIERFPGASSWADFQECLTGIEQHTSKSYPWIRLTRVPQLSSARPSKEEDARVVKEIRELNKNLHVLQRYPNAWMTTFGVTAPEDVARENTLIISSLRNRESVAHNKRLKSGKGVFGVKRLKSQQILQKHTPKPRERNIFIITTEPDIRIDYIARMKAFSAKCKDCYQRWKAGELSVEWPPGAFKPPLPPTVSILSPSWFGVTAAV